MVSTGGMTMFKRVLAISFIYVCTVAGWMILAGTLLVRTEALDGRLRDAVEQLWGTAHTQTPPQVYLKSSASRTDNEQGYRETVALDSSDITVDLKLEHRRKGLLWYSTYHVQFAGVYTVVNHSPQAQEMVVDFKFPAEQAIYDNFRFAVGGQEVSEVELKSGNIVQPFRIEPGESKTVEIAYDSQGLDEWNYDFGSSVKQVRNFSPTLNTDFDNIDFPQRSISPTAKEKTADGWSLNWRYTNLLTGVKIGMVMPKRLNPGPWVMQLTAAAPVSLFLFFFLLFVCTAGRSIRLHPMNYFFIGAAFFSFHLLLAYLVDHVSIHTAFWLCSAVSVFLVVSYMRLVVGIRFAFVEVALFQLVYLVLFSYTFFFAGYTGLAITVLCVCTLFAVMQFTARIDWEKVFEKTPEKKLQS